MLKVSQISSASVPIRKLRTSVQFPRSSRGPDDTVDVPPGGGRYASLGHNRQRDKANPISGQRFYMSTGNFWTNNLKSCLQVDRHAS